MSVRVRPLFILCASFIVAIGFLAKSANAATSLGFAVSPPAFDLAANPGQTVASSVKLINLTDQPLSLTVDRNNFVARGEEGQIDLTTQDNLYSLAPWFIVTTGDIVVPAKGTTDVSFSIAVPLNAEPGGRYGSLVFHTNPGVLPSGQSGAAVKQQLATLIFLRINGPAYEKLSVASFSSDKTFYQYGPIVFSTRIADLGNVHEKPTGIITVKNMIGGTAATISIVPENVIPTAIRKIDTPWSKHLLFGRYTATIVLKNGATQTLTASTSFTVIPYKLLGIILVVLIALYIIIWKGRKRLKRAFKALFGSG
ncbi:MAG: hypothetical protein ACHQUB_01805 [Candidatus Saccharimonadia bacterium]